MRLGHQPSGTVPWSDRGAKNAPCRFHSSAQRDRCRPKNRRKKRIHANPSIWLSNAESARPWAARLKIMHSHLSFTSRYSSADYLRPGQQIRREWRSWSIFPAAFCGPRCESWSERASVCCMLFVYCFWEHGLLFYMALIFFIPVHTKLRGYQIFRKDWNNGDHSSMGALAVAKIDRGLVSLT